MTDEYVFGLHLTGQKEKDDEEYQFGTHLPKRTKLKETGRQAGLAARAGLGGVAKTFTGINDAFLMAGNELARWMGMEGPGVKLTTPMVDRALDAAGLPKAANNRERVVQLANEFISGGSPFLAAGKVTPFLAPLSEAPMMQTVSNLSAGVGVGTAREMGVQNPLVETGIGLATGAAPIGAQTGLAAATRGAVRGSDPSQMIQNIDQFTRAGVQPSVANATGNPAHYRIENTLEGMPYAGRLSDFKSAQIEQAQTSANNLSDTLAPRMTNQEVGSVIERGFVGPGGWIERTRNQANQLYEDVERTFDNKLRISLSKTQDALNPGPELSRHAPNTAKAVGSVFSDKLADALGEDLFNNLVNVGTYGIPYSAVKELRSAIGRKLDDSLLVADFPKAELKRIYAALSDDMDAGARRYGGEAASAAAAKASEFWKQRMATIDKIDSVIELKGGPEKVYNAIMSGTKDGATTLTEVMGALNPAEQDVIRATVVRRMGQSIPSRQSADGTRYSLETYLTNWNKLSPEAKNILFNHDPEIARATDAIAHVAEQVKLGAEHVQNRSGTAPRTAHSMNLFALGGAATALFSGTSALPMLGYAGTAAFINGLSRSMANPLVVRWLARTTQLPTEALPAALNQFIQMAEESEDPQLLEIMEDIKRTQ